MDPYPMDRYQRLAHSPVGRRVLPRIGLPQPPILRRYAPGQPLLDGPVLLGGVPGGRLADVVARELGASGADVDLAEGASWRTEAGADRRWAALVLDATGISDVAGLVELPRFFTPVLRRLGRGGRVVVLADPPEECHGDARVAQRALEGFTRSLGRELGSRGSTVTLVRVASGADERLASTLRFLLSARSAFVSGQVVRIGTGVAAELPDGIDGSPASDADRPHQGRVAVVTGAARGIGASIAETFTRGGGTVVGIDVAALASDLARSVGDDGSWLAADVTASDAPERIARHVRDRHGRLDVVVHNAGITRDRRLVNMEEDGWTQVLDVNLRAPQRITAALVEQQLLGAGGRVVGVSSVTGIAGNNGQTNYATSKAGVIGMVDALAGPLAERGVTINAVAPGFIETSMTAKIPFGVREGARRLSSLLQGGQPIDVAETVCWLAEPGSFGVTGNVVRVCGQALVGA